MRRVGRDAVEGPFELADVGGHLAGDELERLGVHAHALLLRLGAQDGDAGLEVGRGQVGDEAPLEAAAQALLERDDLLGWPVAREDDLLAVLVDGVEGVEELLLGPLLVGDELDVIDEQQVDLAVARPEVVDAALLDAGDEVVGELLAGGVDDPLARVALHHGVADRVHQVGLAEADAAVQEERVVGLAGTLGDRQAGGMREAVGRADDEGAEGVAGVEVDAAALGRADAARLDADLGVVRSSRLLLRLRLDRAPRGRSREPRTRR